MSDKSTIEWTDSTWNPVRGCIKVSPGCKHCYAETFAERWRGIAGHPYERGFDPRLVPDKLGEPLRWRKGRRIFVNSMSDLFQEAVPDDYIAAVFGVMMFARRHTFQVLTKRAERLPAWTTALQADPIRLFKGMEQHGIKEVASGFGPFTMNASPMATAAIMQGIPWPLPNVHLGVSVEDRRFGVPRIEHLRNAPAAVRFLSIEPLLEDVGTLDLTGIHQVIVGGESGNGARPCEVDWIRNVVRQARAAGVAVFVKQVGAAYSDPINSVAGRKLKVDTRLVQIGRRLKSSKGGDMAEWPADLRIREFPGGA